MQRTNSVTTADAAQIRDHSEEFIHHAATALLLLLLLRVALVLRWALGFFNRSRLLRVTGSLRIGFRLLQAKAVRAHVQVFRKFDQRLVLQRKKRQ